MTPAHDEARREQALALHRRNSRVCAACGQSWPCTEYAWAGGPEARTQRLRRLLRGLLLVLALATVLVPVEVVLLVRLAHALGVWP